jgi:ATP-dependent Clp protease ATP-binding subunit ClpA
MDIEFGDDVVRKIADIGYEPEFGARPMRRAIQKEIENKLSELMLKDEFSEGDKIKAKVEDGEIAFEKLK